MSDHYPHACHSGPHWVKKNKISRRVNSPCLVFLSQGLDFQPPPGLELPVPVYSYLDLAASVEFRLSPTPHRNESRRFLSRRPTSAQMQSACHRRSMDHLDPWALLGAYHFYFSSLHQKKLELDITSRIPFVYRYFR